MMRKLKKKMVAQREPVKKIKFQTNDKVIVLTGKDKGKVGLILSIKKGFEYAKVEKVNSKTHYIKSDGVNSGGIFEEEGWIHISNISHVTSEGKPTKVRMVKEEGKKKIFSKKTGEELRTEQVAKGPKIQVEDKEQRKEKEDLKKTQFMEEEKKKAGVVQKKKEGQPKDIKKKGDK